MEEVKKGQTIEAEEDSVLLSDIEYRFLLKQEKCCAKYELDDVIVEPPKCPQSLLSKKTTYLFTIGISIAIGIVIGLEIK